MLNPEQNRGKAHIKIFRSLTRLRDRQLRGALRSTRHLQLAVQVDNVMDHHYYTAGQIENTPFTNSGTLIFRPFPMYPTRPQAGNDPLQSSTLFAPGAP
jgi:hypothetical protein